MTWSATCSAAGDENSKHTPAKSDNLTMTTIKSLPRTIAIVSLAFAAILSLRADTRTIFS